MHRDPEMGVRRGCKIEVLTPDHHPYGEMMAAYAEDASTATRHASWMRYWLRQRNSQYILRRARSLAERYGLTAGRAEARTRRFVHMLALRGHAPTLAVPGRVVARHGDFMRELRDQGVELAVHSFDHIDFRSLAPHAHREQFEKALAAFDRERIPVTGFRCPYLGYEPSMSADVPSRLLYSSNLAVRWPGADDRLGAEVYDALQRFYDPVDVGDAPILPSDVGGLLELPVSLPDDLQLLDGLGCSADEIGDVWGSILTRSRARGDLFVALVHPETADVCADAFSGMLDLAGASPRPSWVTTLAEVAAWWRERQGFDATVRDDFVSVACTARATVLARGLDGDGAGGPRWDERWTVATSSRIAVSPEALPFVGLRTPAPEVERALRDEGYVVRVADESTRCATVLDSRELADLGSAEAVVRHVGDLRTPAIRFWRWPDGASSCLSVTGDLDALSLADYATRLSLLRASGTTTARVGALLFPPTAEHRRSHPTRSGADTTPERQGGARSGDVRPCDGGVVDVHRRR